MFGYNNILAGFTVIEGIDGAGTSTQRKLLSQALAASGKPVFDTWEPSEGPVGRLIRQALRSELSLEQGTIARLFAADRHEHLEGPNGIRQRCARGEAVVCDRYVFSSLAYQGLYLDRAEIWELNRHFPLPERLIFVDVDLETSADRRLQRGEAAELYDADALQRRVRESYHEVLRQLAQERPELAVLWLDGRAPIAELHGRICEFIQVPPLDVR